MGLVRSYPRSKPFEGIGAVYAALVLLRRNMIHKCKYFLKDDEGIRRCVQCGKPTPQIEDKVIEKHEDKQIYPSESKRLNRKKTKKH